MDVDIKDNHVVLEYQNYVKIAKMEKLKMEAAHQADSIAAATRAADSLAALEGTMVPDSTVVDTTVAVEAAH